MIMTTVKAIRCNVLKAYPKAVVHLRRQFSEQRFGLVLGAGVGRDFRIPIWKKLVDRIANDPRVDGCELLKGHVDEKSLPYKTEMLFQRFREKTLSSLDKGLSELAQQSTIAANWLEVCATHLYADVDPNIESALKSHPYFETMLPLVQGSGLTINFNFDNFLERSLAFHKRECDKENKGFEVVTDPWPQFRRKDSVIYHPHGMVPDRVRLMELPIGRFVFSEAAYSAQYVGSRGHDSSFLITHFARNTCLLLGCSLEDELRNVLMRGAQINPGNYHYYVHYIEDGVTGPNEDQKALISETNFNVYNLITLFLTSKEVRALFELLNDDEVKLQEFKDLALQHDVRLNYNYYLTGPLGVGKSTTANLLRSLHVLDEWLEARPQVLAVPWDELTPEQSKEADEWIAGQFLAKNNTLRDLPPAIASVDRPPLDPLVFTKVQDRAAKAKSLIDTICPGRKWDVVSGVVILLSGDPEVLSARVRTTGRQDYTVERLSKMQDNLRDIYRGEGVHEIDTRHLSVLEVTKKVAEIVHRNDYRPFDLMQALFDHERGPNGNI
jgi:broad-specificity NMP kinase